VADCLREMDRRLSGVCRETMCLTGRMKEAEIQAADAARQHSKYVLRFVGKVISISVAFLIFGFVIGCSAAFERRSDRRPVVEASEPEVWFELGSLRSV